MFTFAELVNDTLSDFDAPATAVCETLLGVQVIAGAAGNGRGIIRRTAPDARSAKTNVTHDAIRRGGCM